eukprot:6378540-Alexandrium_andersonii.AAC.1
MRTCAWLSRRQRPSPACALRSHGASMALERCRPDGKRCARGQMGGAVHAHFGEPGVVQGKARACCSDRPEEDLRRVVRGDDFAFVGLDADLGEIQHGTEEHFTFKVEGRLGGGAGGLGEARLLDRVARWTSEGLLRESGPRHAEQLIRGLLGARVGMKAASLPGSSGVARASRLRWPWAQPRPAGTARWQRGRTS